MNKKKKNLLSVIIVITVIFSLLPLNSSTVRADANDLPTTVHTTDCGHPGTEHYYSTGQIYMYDYQSCVKGRLFRVDGSYSDYNEDSSYHKRVDYYFSYGTAAGWYYYDNTSYRPCLHSHTWEYSLVDANSIKATCNASGHGGENDIVIILAASDTNYASITGLDTFNTLTGRTTEDTKIKESDVKLYKVGTEGATSGGALYTGAIYEGRPTEKGNYYSSLTIEGVTAVKAFKTTNKIWTVADGQYVDYTLLSDGDVLSKTNDSNNHYLISSGQPFYLFYRTSPTYECFFSSNNMDASGFTRFTVGKTGDMYTTRVDYKYTVARDPRHFHDWQYSVTNNKIEAYCASANCPSNTDASHKVSLTLTANNMYHSGSAYNKASLSDTTSWTGAGLTVPTIKYVGRGNTTYTESETAPTVIGTYIAKITAGDVTVSVNFEIKDPSIPDTVLKDGTTPEVPNGTDKQVVNITPVVKDNDLSAKLSNDDLKEALGLTTSEQASGVWAWMELNAKEVNSNDVPTDDKTKISDGLDGKTLGTYIDISIYKQVQGQDKTRMSETLDKKVTITITVPSSLRSVGQDFTIVYTHAGGEAQTITPESYNEATGELVFKANEFSTYALAYTPKPAAPSPNPGYRSPDTSVR